MLLVVRDRNKRQQRSGVVIEAMHLDRPLGLPKLGPRKDRQTKVNDRGTEREQQICKPEPLLRRVVLAPRAQMIKQTFKDLVAPAVVGIRKSAAPDVLHTQVIPAGLKCIPSCHDVPDTIFLLDLGEQDFDILVPRRIRLDVSVTLVLFYSFFEVISRVRVSTTRRRSSPTCAWLVPPCRNSVWENSIILQVKESGHAFLIFTVH